MLSRLNTLRFSLAALIPFSSTSTSKIQTPNRLAHAMAASHTGPSEFATFASGCFWGTEHIFLKKFPPTEGQIVSTKVGYTGGREDVRSPSYRDVCTGATGHAEAVRIEFDPQRVGYGELVGAFCFRFLLGGRRCDADLLMMEEYFYRTHNPTQVNRQGPDTGTRMSLPYIDTHIHNSRHSKRIPLSHLLSHSGAEAHRRAGHAGGPGEPHRQARAEDRYVDRACAGLVRCGGLSPGVFV